MIVDILEDENYRDIMKKQIKEIMTYLHNQNEEFSVTSNIKGVSFYPEIPEPIRNNFSKFTMFSLTNYTYSTIEISDSSISFEAGFGEENFGSVVTIPFYAIFQLVANDSILFVNPTATVDKYFIKDNLIKDEGNQKDRSRNAFSMNPKNKSLI